MEIKDKRKHPRFNVNRIVEIGIMKENTFNAFGLNISEGGIFCESDYPVKPLSRVSIMFTMTINGKDHTIECEGSVIHVRKEGKKNLFGVHFSGLMPEEQRLIRSFVAKAD